MPTLPRVGKTIKTSGIAISERFRPNPVANCGRCLYRLGFGYSRIATLFMVSRGRVISWVRIGRKRGEIKGANPQNRIGQKNTLYLLQPHQYQKKQPKPYVCRRKTPKWSLSHRKRKIYLRRKVWAFFKHGLYPRNAAAMVGCSLFSFRHHISEQFTEGMGFGNYGKWHLDHIIPCAKFDLSNPEEVKRCFHYLNFRPMWARANRIKSATAINSQPELMFPFALYNSSPC